MKHYTQKYQMGFTLLEVMVVVVIIGILSAITVHFFGEKIVQDRLSGSAKETKAFIQQKAKSFRVSSSAMSIGVVSGDNLVKQFASSDCSGSVESSLELSNQVSFIATSSATTECKSGNTWTSQNGHWCLVMDDSTPLFPTGVGCFALQHTGNSNLSVGLAKPSTHNYIRTWIKNGSSFRWVN